MRIAAETGIPVLRPMFFEFPDQEDSYLAEDQFMFGPDWLVAPVTVYNATHRSVFLPMLSSPSEVWVHHYTQRAYRGSQRINMYSHLPPRTLFTYHPPSQPHASGNIPSVYSHENSSVVQRDSWISVLVLRGGGSCRRNCRFTLL